MNYTWNNIKIEKGQGYYNISTKRWVGNTKRKDLIFMDLSNDIKICGKPEDIEKFNNENFIISDQNNHIQIKKTKKINILKCLFFFCYDDTDIENCEDIDTLSNFGLSNIYGKGEIRRVIDGDTFEVLVYIKLNDLTKEFETGRQHLMKSPIKTKYNKAGYFTILKVRLMGADAAEHDTYHGQQATEHMKNNFNKFNNIIWYHIPENNYKRPDPHNRTLMWIFTDRSRKQNVTDYLLSLKFYSTEPKLLSWNGTPLAKSYDGGTKDDYMKTLPKLIS